MGFYFKPVYAQPDLGRVFRPELLGPLRGKSCFHILKLTPMLEQQVEDALKKGYALYKERGWV